MIMMHCLWLCVYEYSTNGIGLNTARARIHYLFFNVKIIIVPMHSHCTHWHRIPFYVYKECCLNSRKMNVKFKIWTLKIGGDAWEIIYINKFHQMKMGIILMLQQNMWNSSLSLSLILCQSVFQRMKNNIYYVICMAYIYINKQRTQMLIYDVRSWNYKILLSRLSQTRESLNSRDIAIAILWIVCIFFNKICFLVYFLFFLFVHCFSCLELLFPSHIILWLVHDAISISILIFWSFLYALLLFHVHFLWNHFSLAFCVFLHLRIRF